MRSLFEYCPNLTKFNLFINTLPKELQLGEGAVLLTYYPSLTKLSVEGDGIAGAALHDIFTYCTNLREVELRNFATVSDALVTVLFRNCAGLDTLNLSGCSKLTIAGLLEVATHCTNLDRLCFSDMPVNDEVLIQLSLYCTILSSVHLFHCNGGLITEAGVRAVAERCTGLTFLSMHGMTCTSTLDLTKLRQLYPRINFKIGR